MPPTAHMNVHPVNLDPPELIHSVLEGARVFLEMGSSAALRPMFRLLPRGDGHSVMALPGFFGADGSTAPLRGFLNRRGYKALPWGLGRNMSDGGSMGSLDDFLDHRGEVEKQIADRVEAEFHATGRKVSLIGWSLGGLYAVGIAHRYPDYIRQVITLGTPYGDPRGTALYNVLGRVYEAEVDESALQRWIEYTYLAEQPLSVPVTALYSDSDGIVGRGIARCQANSEHVENIRVSASHVGFPFNPAVWALISLRLGRSEDQWQPLRIPACLAPLARIASPLH